MSLRRVLSNILVMTAMIAMGLVATRALIATMDGAITPDSVSMSVAQASLARLWHRRLGHPGVDAFNQMTKTNPELMLFKSKHLRGQLCETCSYAKSKRNLFCTSTSLKPISMTNQVQHGHTFNNFPSALYCTDVKFQPSYHPTGRFDEAKHYFSGKHKLYGLKLEYSVAYPCVAVNRSEHSPGSVADVTMFMHRRHVHKDMLRKSASEIKEVDHDEGAEEYPDSWSILVDMGYQGIQHEVRSMQPKRRPQGGLLTARELERNAQASSDRVLMENYFGRICSLWKVMRETYKWNESRFDRI
ncbi:hypothetical protein H257_08798 [Aphanomyces astaci]|uniref:DDE Tnp4 domain-containing protein n=1 Tax=Aphanomyces astaci TaxID=112090 RepID=W4GCE7_APHAT|nr:hypothetical protein H257_08798 [Aphanomyces astaci]ETV77362.1 hypothetical protein H257_08798 [Aphanomyces astaci]|eukprot:XP_009833149.1 hypothetical protein H257_08798 [Aphanomyces astaci]